VKILRHGVTTDISTYTGIPAAVIWLWNNLYCDDQ